MSAPRILFERDGTIVTLTLNRPDKLNAIDGAMLDALEEVLSRLEADRDARAVILTGAGGRSRPAPTSRSGPRSRRSSSAPAGACAAIGCSTGWPGSPSR